MRMHGSGYSANQVNLIGLMWVFMFQQFLLVVGFISFLDDIVPSISVHISFYVSHLNLLLKKKKKIANLFNEELSLTMHINI